MSKKLYGLSDMRNRELKKRAGSMFLASTFILGMAMTHFTPQPEVAAASWSSPTPYENITFDNVFTGSSSEALTLEGGKTYKFDNYNYSGKQTTDDNGTVTATEPGLKINGEVHIYIYGNCSFTGANGSGTVGGAPGIEVPKGSKLWVHGPGKFAVTGGNGGNGQNSSDTINNLNNSKGGGGAGAAIGTRGGTGSGEDGVSGDDAEPAGNLYALNAGTAALTPGEGGSGGEGRPGYKGWVEYTDANTAEPVARGCGGGSSGNGGGGGGLRGTHVGSGGGGGGSGGRGAIGISGTFYSATWAEWGHYAAGAGAGGGGAGGGNPTHPATGGGGGGGAYSWYDWLNYASQVTGGAAGNGGSSGMKGEDCGSGWMYMNSVHADSGRLFGGGGNPGETAPDKAEGDHFAGGSSGSDGDCLLIEWVSPTEERIMYEEKRGVFDTAVGDKAASPGSASGKVASPSTSSLLGLTVPNMGVWDKDATAIDLRCLHLTVNSPQSAVYEGQKLTTTLKCGDYYLLNDSQIPEDITANHRTLLSKLKFTWKCGGKEVGSKHTYTPTPNDVGKTITLTVDFDDNVSAENRYGDPVTTVPTDPVQSNNSFIQFTPATTENSTSPDSSSTMPRLKVGDKIIGTISGTNAEYYTWYRDDIKSTPIKQGGEDANEYPLTVKDIGRNIICKVHFADNDKNQWSKYFVWRCTECDITDQTGYNLVKTTVQEGNCDITAKVPPVKDKDGNITTSSHDLIKTWSGANSNPFSISSPSDLVLYSILLDCNPDSLMGLSAKLTTNTTDTTIDISQYNSTTKVNGKDTIIRDPVATKDVRVIGTYQYPFKAMFDGNGKKISNLKITETDRGGVGLFGCIYDGTVKNLTLANPVIKGRNHVGGIVGYATGTTISTCEVDMSGSNKYADKTESATITGTNDSIGGIAGAIAQGSTISGCSVNKGTIQGKNVVGGIVGDCYNSTATGSSSNTTLSGGRTSTSIANKVDTQ